MDVREHIIAMVHRQLAELEAGDAVLTTPVPGQRAGKRPPGPSRVYSFRLDVEEVAALRRRAAFLGIPPTVLARNLVRIGLTSPDVVGMNGIVDRLECSVAELRALVP
jgi:hypothetical protein